MQSIVIAKTGVIWWGNLNYIIFQTMSKTHEVIMALTKEINTVKTVLSISILLSMLSSSVKASLNSGHEQADCNKTKNLQTLMPTSGNKDQFRQIAAINYAARSTKSAYIQLGRSICTAYERAGNVSTRVPYLIYKHMREVEGIKNPEYNLDKVLTKLNQHKNDLLCYDGDSIITRAFKRGLHNTVVHEVLLSELITDRKHFDFNAVTKAYNPATKRHERMTTLDWLEKVALNERAISGNKGSRLYREIEDFIEMIDLDFGGKRLREFTRSELAALEKDETKA